eukprot:CAMPEP_0176110996 /NCGR_PEP_ID=MMETSP0120_2-20121206/55735_1 /TAXON_ID=160619 /ORGANISM="Kryptoperidinium foliaceum, Strain CCMP 1326" /LENGTH=157 /DNA_ID=CAMNT_0017445203 /DNA_START=1 /DNA_END=471 /DNA_ORIENTATION=-
MWSCCAFSALDNDEECGITPNTYMVDVVDDSAAPDEVEGAEVDTYIVNLERSEDEPWGLCVEFVDGCPPVVSEIVDIEQSIAGAYNKSASSNKQLRYGDIVLSVNGITPGHGMRKELQNGLRGEFKLRRPKMLTISIPKDGKPLGLKLNYVKGAVTM